MFGLGFLLFLPPNYTFLYLIIIYHQCNVCNILYAIALFMVHDLQEGASNDSIVGLDGHTIKGVTYYSWYSPFAKSLHAEL